MHDSAVPAYKSSFLHVLFGLKGRCTRFDYWVKYGLFHFVFFIVLVLLAEMEAWEFFRVVNLIMMPLSVWVSIAVGIKRCHDRNRTGWFMLLGLIPFLNLWVFIELCFLDGTYGPNQYGQDPKGRPELAFSFHESGETS
ncbi:MAG: DUF805 domain-containing protein [Pseudodesulfovibrio sp.]